MTNYLGLGAAMCALCISSAAAQDSTAPVRSGFETPAGSWYGQVGLGLSAPTEDGAAFGDVEGELDYTVGAAFGGLLGYQRGSVAIEVEATGRTNDFDGNVSEEDLTVTALLLNGVLSGPDTSRWVPYIGAGVGYAFSNIEDADGSFAFQAKGGLRYGLGTGASSVGVEAAYLSTGGFEDEDFGIDVDYASFSVMATYKINFGY